MARTPIKRKRSFGNVRKLPSGRWQARYTGPDGKVRTAQDSAGRSITFDGKRDADMWLAIQQSAIGRGQWLTPEPVVTAAPLTLREYAGPWLADRELATLTRELYAALLANHIYPAFGNTLLAEITPPAVRSWYARLATGATARSHAYGLLRTILNTAVDDELIASNPCRIRGAGRAKRAKPIVPATVDELEIMVRIMPPKYQLMVLLAAWCAPRFGELFELRRRDVDLTTEGLPLLWIRRSVAITSAGRIVKGPKSDAGVRKVDIPPHLVPAIEAHLAEHAAPGKDGLLFPGGDGVSHMCEKTLRPHWHRAREAAGRKDLTWHGLRHTSATFAAQAGASLKELMVRLGHSTPATAMLYQHAADKRGPIIAATLSAMATAKNVTPIAEAPSVKAKKSRKRPA